MGLSLPNRVCGDVGHDATSHHAFSKENPYASINGYEQRVHNYKGNSVVPASWRKISTPGALMPR